MRRNIFVTFFMSIIVNVGMWFERFVIIVTFSVNKHQSIRRTIGLGYHPNEESDSETNCHCSSLFSEYLRDVRYHNSLLQAIKSERPMAKENIRTDRVDGTEMLPGLTAASPESARQDTVPTSKHAYC